MNIRLNGSLKDISAMILSAERYALGRRTYIVDWTCGFIVKNLHLILEKDKRVMIRDIKECEYYGDDFDKAEWLELLNILEADVNAN